jgi:hypothetical protein
MASRKSRSKPSAAYYPVVVSVEVVGPTSLLAGFDNGVKRRVNLKPLLHGPVFVPLHRPAYFRKARACPDAATVVWPNGADIAPETLYEMPEEKPVRRRAPLAKRKARTPRR